MSGDLDPGDVAVHRCALAESEAASLAPLLSPEEEARAARFAFPRERDRFTVSRGRLRLLLARLAGGDPRGLRLETDAGGKPRLAEGRLRFNVSHSGALWACAVALDREVGLDVEEVREDRDVERLAGRYFAPAEAGAILALPAAERSAAFHRCWTRKEAALKARGTGITVPLESVAEDSRWTLRDVDLGPGFAAAVCAEGPVRAVSLR